MKRKYNNEKSTSSTNIKSISNKKENNLFIRNTEHTDGNWPSHIYLKGNYKLINDISNICIKHHASASKHSELDEMISIDDPHISLSKPFVLRFHQIIPFVKLLNQTLQNLYSFNVEIQSQYKLLRNEYNTRLFLALPVYDLHNMMTNLIEKVDHCLKQYQQPVYYLSPVYHISIASIPLNPDRILPIVNTDEFIITLSKEDIDNIIKHEKDSAIISESFNYNNVNNNVNNNNDEEEDDDDDNWQESMQKHHRKTRYFKHSCSTDMYSNISNADHNFIKNISLITTNKTTATSLLTDYESDDDNNNNNYTKTNTKEVKTIVAGLYQILTINSIECKIGNKIFQLLLPNANHVEDNVIINQKNVFIEM